VSAPRKHRPFAARLVAWQARRGRRDLPWQASRDPYRIWLSEVMLQQTQVAAVIPYFERFCARFPDVTALASAPLEDVLALWAGLGYYARARNLHACARRIVEDHGGRLPLDAAALAKLPGIGRSTAGAISAFCASARAPILDGNVRRVLSRHFAVEGWPGAPAVERVLWALAESLLPPGRQMPAYTQALMDLGATVCTRRAPDCARCPVAKTCAALATGRVEELPAPRPRRRLPRRRAWALVALHGDRVLLHRRAPSGLWGGLYALPQFDSLAALRRAAAALDPRRRLTTMPPRRHAFTHFSLTLLPRRLDIDRLASELREDDRRWLPLGEIDAAPLPAPVRALLHEIASDAAGAPVPANPGRRRSPAR
jgi:A/G-specific adenine glycosylase